MSVFDHIAQAMDKGGYEVLMISWIITALIISWFYAIPLGIKALFERIKDKENDKF